MDNPRSMGNAHPPAAFTGTARSTEQLNAISTDSTLLSPNDLMQTALDNMPTLIFIKDAAGRFVMANQAMAKLFNTTPAELIGKLPADINTDTEQVGVFANQDRRVMATGEEQFIPEYPITGADGRKRWFQTFKRPLKGSDGFYRYVLAVSEEITGRRESELSIIESRETLRSIYDLLMARGSSFDETVRRLLESGLRRFGYEIGLFTRVNEDTVDVLESVYEEDNPVARQTIPLHDSLTRRFIENSDKALKFGGIYLQSEEIAGHPNAQIAAAFGSPVTVGNETYGVLIFASKKPHPYPTTSDCELLGIMANWIGAELERRQAQDTIRKQATHDTLTGLPNRACFLDRLDRALKRSRWTKANVAVLFLDLDNFKVVNDTLGHAAGDSLLITIAERIAACVRPCDTVARLGGDEFTVILEDITGEEQAVTVAERMLHDLRASIDLGGREVFPTASIGIALSSAEARTCEDLLRNADTAMYEAKSGGRAQAVLFNDAMNQHTQELLTMESELRAALPNNEFVLYFQPIMDLNSRRVCDVEALIRWQHPYNGLLSPARFLPLAEETGFIVDMGYWILREACRQAKNWEGPNFMGGGLGISVNLSAKQVAQPDLVERVALILHETGLNPARLKLEINEGVLMRHPEATTQKLRQLKALGVLLAVDDFGTGYSSMTYLTGLPVDTLKIDRSFIARMAQKGEDEHIVQALVELAKTLGIKVTSEGIETEEQFDKLLQMQCDEGQGFLFSRPVLGSEIDALSQNMGSLRGEVGHDSGTQRHAA